MNNKFKRLIPQFLTLLLVVLIFGFFTLNAQVNMDNRGIDFGFGFLKQEASFDIQFSLVEYDGLDPYWWAYVAALLNTLLVAVLGIIFCTIIGVIVGVARLSSNYLIRNTAAWYVEFFRNIPLLLQIFFWYYAALRALPLPQDAEPLLGVSYLTIKGFYIPAMIWENLNIFLYSIVLAIIGIIIVRVFSKADPGTALRTGTIGSAILFIIAAYFLIQMILTENAVNTWLAVLAGAVGGVIIGLITEYYTGSKPVEKIAKSGETGPATVMITGLSVGMQSVVLPILVLATIILVSTSLVGLYGVGIAAVGMLATVGITMAIDAYGPVADNAGGIAEMSGMGSETREITDSLDELGNSTAAIGKGFAIGAAALAALAIIAAFVETVAHNRGSFELLLSDPRVLVGMFIGISIPFLISSITMTAVGDAAFDMINEIRRQFREIPGLLEGNAEPDTAKCVDIATSAALKRMLLPGVIAVSAPAVVGFGLGPESLGGMLGGGLIGCVSMALMMANAGGAWDNAKKFIEKGNLGGKGTDTHSAAVVGDTVGDPFKDTSGPSMNILINVMAIVSLVISPLL